MKKKLLLTVVISIIGMCFSSCGDIGVPMANLEETTTSIENINANSLINNENDYEYKITENLGIPKEFQGKKILDTYPLLEYETEMNIQGISKYTNHIITGKINDISYTSIGDSKNGKAAWTIINVTVNENLYGNIKTGENINIYTCGGYVSMRDKLGDLLYAKGEKYGEGNKLSEEEIDNTVYHEIINSGELPIIGQEYAFYLANGNEYMNENSYIVIGGENGQLLKFNDKFIRKYIITSNDNIKKETIEEYLHDDLAKYLVE